MNESPTVSTEPNIFAGGWRRPYCSICNNRQGQILDGQRIKLHQFPTNDQLRKNWIQRLKSVMPSIQITRKSRLCSAHFIGGVYDRAMNAVPSIFILNDMEKRFKHIQPLQEKNQQSKTDPSSSTCTCMVDIGTSIGDWLAAASVYGETTTTFVYHLLYIHAKYCIACAALSSITQGSVPQAPVTEESTTLEKIIKTEHNYCIPSNTDEETEFLTPDESSMPPSTSTATPSIEPYQFSKSKAIANQSTHTYGCTTSMGETNPSLDTYIIAPSVNIVNQPSEMNSSAGSTSIGVENPSLDTDRMAPLVIPTNQTPDLYNHMLKRLESKSLEGGQKSDDTLNFKIMSDSMKNSLVSGNNGDCGTGPAQQKSVALPYYEQPVVIPTSSAQTDIDTADNANVYNIDFNHLEKLFPTNEHLADLESYISGTDFGQGSSQPTRHQGMTTVTSPAIAADTPLLDEAANVVSNLPQDSDYTVVAELGPYIPLIAGSLPTDAPLPYAIPTGSSSKGARPQYNKSYRQTKVPVSCPHCQKTLSSLITLSRHMNIHNKNPRFVCSVCGKGHSSKSDLKYHMHVHTNFKSFECTVCSKKFCKPDSLKNHMKLHLGVKDIPCEYCDELFVTRLQRKYHRIKVHAIGVMPVGKRIPTVCEYCGKELKSPHGLKIHYNTHDEIPKIEVCSQCGKMFANSTSLLHHISKIHVRTQKVVCHICGMSWSKGKFGKHIKHCQKKIK